MAELTGKAVSELPAATTIGDSDLLALSQSGASKKITPPILLTGVMKSRSSITTAPSSVDEIMSYLQGVYRVGISGSQSIFPANYGLLEIIICDSYGMARFTQINSSMSKIWTRLWNRNDNTWYDSTWINVVGVYTPINSTINFRSNVSSTSSFETCQTENGVAVLKLFLTSSTDIASADVVIASGLPRPSKQFQIIANSTDGVVYRFVVNTSGELHKWYGNAMPSGTNFAIDTTYFTA